MSSCHSGLHFSVSLHSSSNVSLGSTGSDIKNKNVFPFDSIFGEKMMESIVNNYGTPNCFENTFGLNKRKKSKD